jgi:pimeloyl-ACP methyl ester carboxylesterase
MQRFKTHQRLFIMSSIVVIGLLISSCSSSPPFTPSKHSSQPTKIQNSTANPLLLRSMRIDVGGYQLYMQCMGHGTPTVLFEAGLGEDVSTWNNVQPEVAQFTQTCAYDRANNGKSGQRPATIKISAQQIAKELHLLLLNGHIPGPYVFVGHSAGGLFLQMYACQYPQDVTGMVLIDSTHPEQAVQLAQALGPEFTKEARQSFPAEGMAYDDLLAIQAQIVSVKDRFPNVPLIVLARSIFKSGPTWTAEQLRTVWMSLQTDLSKRSSKGKLIIADNSSHFIQNDRPDLVIQSIQQVIQQAQHP